MCAPQASMQPCSHVCIYLFTHPLTHHCAYVSRAKHSTMMVLYHMHNPSAPAFVHTCNNCRAVSCVANVDQIRMTDEIEMCRAIIESLLLSARVIMWCVRPSVCTNAPPDLPMLRARTFWWARSGAAPSAKSTTCARIATRTATYAIHT